MVFPVKVQTSVAGLAEVLTTAASNVVKRIDFIVPPDNSSKANMRLY